MNGVCRMIYRFEKNGLLLVLELEEGKIPLLIHLGLEGSDYCVPAEEQRRYYGVQEVQAAGESRLEHFGVGLSGTMPAARMSYVGHRESENALGTLLSIESQDPVTGLHSSMRYQFFTGLPVVRCCNILTNRGTKPITIEGVSTFVQIGLDDGGEHADASVLIPHNSWQEELQWREMPLYDLGYRNFSEPGASGKRIQIRSLGSWSSGEYLPMGCLRNLAQGTMEFWQIEHNGSWNWELQERDHRCALLISGPDEMDHGWWKMLPPGDSFETVPACVGCVRGGVDEAMAALTRYRRAIRRKHPDHQHLPIIFNDYMNCLFGDPTTEKELPIIEAAAEMGCEYYVIDAGWYTDENWWYKVGEWKPSEKRFPNGLEEVTGFIRSKGMIPGIWLEIETMGTQCPIVDQLPREWFFQRHGQVSLDRDRYHLDFRNPEVRAYTRGVIDRLIRDYGIGYFKIDYNINAFAGTDYAGDYGGSDSSSDRGGKECSGDYAGENKDCSVNHAGKDCSGDRDGKDYAGAGVGGMCSAADGLLAHNRAYLSWLDEIMDAYPDLVIENCSSGGMRMDYAMLSRYCIQSTSDQTDYRKYASIAANAPSAVTPEQAAVWSYPMADSIREQAIFNCVNASLLRIHQSGHFALLSEEVRSIIREFYAFYRMIREEIPSAVPFWPLGFAKEGDGQMALGLRWEACRAYLAVWRLDGDPVITLPMHSFAKMFRKPGQQITARVAFPKEDSRCQVAWDDERNVLQVTLPEKNMARIIKINSMEVE